ncbi:MAG: hypothetical protein IPL27_24315 [Lewinellaceae bacterium]|nr:hypothetical protein [Lewinellaceae bacterium]
MLKRTGWYIAFLIVLLAGDRTAGYLLQQQVAQSQFRYSRMYHGTAGADILLLGNSRGLTFYQPYIEEKTGLKTFNLSYNGLPMDVAKVLVQDYLERYPAPKRMLIDITGCDRTNDELMAGFLAYSGQSFRLDTLIHNKLEKVWWGGKCLLYSGTTTKFFSAPCLTGIKRMQAGCSTESYRPNWLPRLHNTNTRSKFTRICCNNCAKYVPKHKPGA